MTSFFARRAPAWRSPRLRKAGAAFAALVVLAAFFGSACGGDDSTGTKAASPTSKPAVVDARFDGATVAPPIEKPSAVLTDTNGKPYDLQKETEGFVTLLYVGYTHCPDVCPAHMVDISAALKQLPADVTSQIKVVFVTADPARDTPEALGKWLALFNKSFIGLTGTQAEVDKFQEDLGLNPAVKEDLGNGNYSVSHAAFVMAFGTDNIAHLVYPSGMPREAWTHDLPILVKEGWTQ